MKTTKLLLPSRQSALSQLNRLLKTPKYSSAKYYILADENTTEHCLALLVSKVEALQESEFLEIESGESSKTLDIASQLWQALLDMSADRECIIVNLGGGVVTDLGGFVAAGFKRGVRYINIPTTLLGMVDASIGGKTAVNIAGIKNQIGFFHQPEVVCIEPEFLNTLPRREWVSGLCELIKTLMIGDAELYAQFCSMLKADSPVLGNDVIKAAAQIKTAVVKADLYDTGIRKMLNFGHTLGHAIESFSLAHDQNPLSHGEAVGIGIVAEAYLSVKKMGFDKAEYESVARLLSSLVAMPKYKLKDMEELLLYIHADKKNVDGEIRCVLLQAIGQVAIDVAVTDTEVCDVLMHLAKVGK